MVLQEMLDNIDSNYDTSQGSFFYDVLSPVAIKLEKIEKEINETLNRRFVATSTGKDLELNCAEMGVIKKKATFSTGYVIVKGNENSIINEGEKVSSDLIFFSFIETKKIDSTGISKVKIQCDVAGKVGNVPAGVIKSFPKTLSGLHSVTNPEPITGGYDEESDEDLKERYYLEVRTPSSSGNKFDYQKWSLEVPGVGGAKVIPQGNGKGTVKIIIINSEKLGADEQLIKNTFNHIEDVRPTGATISVVSATEKKIDISAKIAVDIDNFTVDTVKEKIKNNLISYFKEIAFKRNYVSYAKVGSIILDTDGVIDYSKLSLNGTTENITIKDDEVVVLGGVAYE